jgi:GPH family glycoside/pentoside/hexuronide:cation symporter
MVSIPAVIWLAGRTEKHVAYAVSVVAWAGVLLGLALVPPEATTWVLVAACLAGPGVAAAHVLPWSMLPDVVEADRVANGHERAGAFYGVMTFLEKIGTALAVNAMLQGLGAAGYVSSTDGETVVQPEAVERAVQLLIGPLPGVVLLVAAAFAWLRPPVTRADHRARVEEAS